MAYSAHPNARVVATVLVAAALSFSAATAAPIIQPGPPGEPAAELAAEAVIKIANTSYSVVDVRFVQDTIPHHHQATEMAALVKRRTNASEYLFVNGISAALTALVNELTEGYRDAGPAAVPQELAAKPRPGESNGISDTGARQILKQAIEAHGGYDALRAASTWTAEVRRHQRGSHYEMTNIYRPGMIRLEQDLPDGGRSADVIGHPHCWGKHGPFSMPCSVETRENDRPRVVMEMAAQLWTLLGNDWRIEEQSGEQSAQDGVRTFVAHYLPLDTDVTFGIDAASGLLSYMTVKGTKEGVFGTHRHEYSDFREQCGVLMPFANVKSFEGDVWVREEFLSLKCIAVDESLFTRPTQVENGFTRTSTIEPAVLACAAPGVLDSLDIEQVGAPLQLIEKTGAKAHCVPVASPPLDAPEGVSIRQLEGRKSVEAYFVDVTGEDHVKLLEPVRNHAERNGQQLSWPLLLRRFDNDGMGLTGESVVLLAMPVETSSFEPL